jgi:hypothetical protein
MRYAVAILLVALTMPASAQKTDAGRSANQMLSGCKGLLDRNMGVPMFNQGRCIGFIDGLGYGIGFCQPDGVTSGQAVAVVVKYIEARPERMHEDFGKLAIEALSAAWPCKPPTRPQFEWPK